MFSLTMNHFNLPISRGIAKRIFIGVGAARNLYSATTLGINGYEKSREKVKIQYLDMEEKFKNKMKELVESETPTTIFTEDLKHMIHLVEVKDEDISLVKNMMTKFCKQNKELRFGSFIFGPVVMRMYHYLNQPIEAYKAFVDLHEDGFFDQLITYQILMDLLYRNEMYIEMLEVFNIVKNKQIQGSMYPKNVVVLAFAACYKLNSKDSLEIAKQIWLDLNKVGHYPMRRAGTFAAALAISQNVPDIALEIITTIRKQSYVTVRNLKVAALADLGRPDDALPILRSVLEFDVSNPGEKHTFNEMIISKMKASVEKFNNAEVTQEFNKIAEELKSLGLIDTKPFDDQLCSEISTPPLVRNSDNRITNVKFRVSQQRSKHRQGLIDMS